MIWFILIFIALTRGENPKPEFNLIGTNYSLNQYQQLRQLQNESEQQEGNQICKVVIKNCKLCFQSGLCKECDKGYYSNKNSGECLPCNSSCEQCDGPSEKNCTICSNNLVFSPQLKQCLKKCKEGQFFNQEINQCELRIQNCLIYSDQEQNLCQLCEFGYSLNIFNNNCESNLNIQQVEDIQESVQKTNQIRNLQQYNNQFSDIQLYTQIIDILSIANISLILISSIFTNFGSTLGWTFIQNQQIIGNYIFCPYLILLQMNQYEMKSSYAHHLFTIIPNLFKFLSSDNQVLLQFNNQSTILKIDDFWSSFLINCFLPLILLGTCILFLFIFFLITISNNKEEQTLSLAQRIYNFIKWNAFVNLFRIIGSFLILDSIFVLYWKKNTSITDYVFSSVFIAIYILLYIYWSLIIGYSYDKIKFQSITQYSTLIQQIEVSNILQRIFWILFEWKKIIITVFQAFFIFDQNKSQITCWIQIGLNFIFLIYLIWKRPFLEYIANIMIIALEIVNLALIIFLGIIIQETSSNLTSNLIQTIHYCYLFTMIGFIGLSIIFQFFYIIQKICYYLKGQQQISSIKHDQSLVKPISYQETKEEKQNQFFEFLYQYNFQSKSQWLRKIQTDRKFQRNYEIQE
ncbi:transmembrane protein, putative (macronuclear) [Tetrahymena thermophila SB210]|uniref:Transmembrane protein, putative n=1 Tax=Tetrahymena thermophila (strain SB210) TaxID=312017 RepID=A4VEA6_TETTS|nr:transmembrane protein, putative [Tetrahymena thermophila SB210]EDK31853.2 transmembrane protein, putative [Tetrahymena thermophila SB210]|eukprot:XP_001471251.2 transmembrane protein, putative [Tetrahymena thermophila SB210]